MPSMIVGTLADVRSALLDGRVPRPVAHAVLREIATRFEQSYPGRVGVEIVPAGRSYGVDIRHERNDPDFGAAFVLTARILVGPRGGVAR